MKNLTRIASLLLALLMLATSAIACGGAKDPDTTTAATTAATNGDAADTTTAATEVTTEAPKYPALPEKNMQGFEMRFLNYDDSYLTWAVNQLDADGITGDLLSDAIYERNARVEETYNCVISETLIARPDSELAALVQSGDVNAEIVMLYDETVVSHYTSGRLLTWDVLSYVDFEQPYWSWDATQTFNIGDKTFAATGDFSLSQSTRSFVLLFNKNMYNELGLTEDMYQLVRDGKWTTEKLVAIAEHAAHDLNGDGAMKIEDDRFGITGAIKLYFGSLVTGAGVKYIDLNEEGNPVFALAGNEYASTVLSDILAKHNGNHVYVQVVDGIHNGSNESKTAFMNNQTLFQGTSMKAVPNYRDMSSDIGILPFPKYSEEQENYCALTSGGAMAAIPTTLSEDSFENVGLILEALSRDSHEGVVDVYKETMLKSKYSRDENSADMLDIIFASAVYDMGLSVFPSDTYYRYMEIFMKGKDTFASTTKSMEKVVNMQLEKLAKKS